MRFFGQFRQTAGGMYAPILQHLPRKEKRQAAQSCGLPEWLLFRESKKEQ